MPHSSVEGLSTYEQNRIYTAARAALFARKKTYLYYVPLVLLCSLDFHAKKPSFASKSCLGNDCGGQIIMV